jgi:hypothetical protein
MVPSGTVSFAIIIVVDVICMCRKPLTDVELWFSITPYVENLGMSTTVEELFF